jgi:hypothetical protein
MEYTGVKIKRGVVSVEEIVRTQARIASGYKQRTSNHGISVVSV